MTTNYDPIAEQYKRSKQQPWRTHIEAFGLLELLGDPAGWSVLDMACGEGFYTRMARQRGAVRVTGIDLSEGMIQLARKQEATHGLGIEYLVADARHFEPANAYDVVIAAYLLNYASNRQELQAMCNGIARCLKPGGRFVTVNASAALNFSTAPSYRKYGFETVAIGAWREGAPVTWTFYLDDGSFTIENYHLDQSVHESAFRAAGFREIRWLEPQVSAEGAAAHGRSFWDDFLDQPPISLIECIK
jgi:ubiquinone/menaquinone biosynthesis C-methylase UbiE